MCVILIASTQRVKRDEMEDAAAIHNDGAGIAWLDPKGRGWRYFKGTSKNAYEKVAKLAAVVQLPYMLHYRMASSGGISPKLAQPFPVSDSLKGTAGFMASGIAHNGHWARGATMADTMSELDGKPWSDTRCIAAMMAHRHPKKWDKVIGKAAGKIVLMDKDGDMTLYGDFETEDGIARSNDWHRHNYTTKYRPDGWMGHATAASLYDESFFTGHYYDEETKMYVSWDNYNARRDEWDIEYSASGNDDDDAGTASDTPPAPALVAPVEEKQKSRKQRKRERRAARKTRRYWSARAGRMISY